ncbi:hypothetical protein BCR34DRAFT_474908 [Clohesyomyces aquaticus]|uniref:1-alkyl-2-acetylglycerophosphocholine esterase n=1 Tax=Clohesyomyces aquaticus TaxID=1231657 RepID=A0A1Y2A4H7_9PLEO|nr:hypothetical protein BCR34DRAFT_474908 [Clohesyomyces aquaticus]
MMSPIFQLLICLLSALRLQAQVLPEPNGQYRVAYTTKKLTDQSRVDPYDPNGGKRNVMISLFYPVAKPECLQICQTHYMPPVTAQVSDANMALTGVSVPSGTFGAIRLQSCCQVSPKGKLDAGKFPIVLFSPGLGISRLHYSAMAQKLASAGYAVATMDHAYEAELVEYLDGNVTFTILTPEYFAYVTDPTHPERLQAVVDLRVQDAQFVLSQLSQLSVLRTIIPTVSCGYNAYISAFFGHSFGGSIALSMIMRDNRLLGAANLDGSVYGTITNIYKLALLFGRDDPHPHNRTTTAPAIADPTWQIVYDHMLGWRRELGLKNSQHYDFTDLPLLVKSGGVPLDAANYEALLGELDGGRAFELVRVYVKAFMDFAVKGIPTPLFSGPTPLYPEVRVG